MSPTIIFVHRQVTQYHGGNRRATGLAQLQRRIGIARHEDLFDGHFGGRVFPAPVGQAQHQQLHALREIVGAQQHQRLVVHVADAAGGVDIDDADPGPLRTGVDAEDAGHAALLAGRNGKRWQAYGLMSVRGDRSTARAQAVRTAQA
ncbi:hypothetical protein G6F32_014763 [Rhizopus arrhizus]|nr:hypothetical protein G6F32_014763 [Rhizopus arrhizus]